MSVDPSVELLDEGPEDDETVTVTWLRPLLPDGQVANARLSDDPVPFIWVNHLDRNERVELSDVDDLVSVHCLYPRGVGNANRILASKFSTDVHRRMLLLARYLEPIVVNGQAVDIDYVDVAMGPRWADYEDEQILHRVARYRIGQSYAKMS